MTIDPTTDRTTTRRPARVALVAVVAALALAVTACSGSSSGSQARVAGIIVKDAWARASAMSSGSGAAYVTIENTTDRVEKLLSASVPSSVAGSASIHETLGSPNEGSGMMAMREVSSILIPAGETVTLAPGGYHIMLTDLVSPLENGQKFMLYLGFMNAGVIEIEVTVRSS